MRIISFNVNGLRARISKGGFPSKDFLSEIQPDIICLQEIRANPKQLPANFLKGYRAYSSIHDKAGYAGAWTFVREGFEEPLLALDCLPNFDEHGRAMILDFKYFKLVNSYSPNVGSALDKMGHRKDYEEALFNYIADAQFFKPVILCGDLNVAPEAIDSNITCRAGCTLTERAAFSKYHKLGMRDIYRVFHVGERDFTFFSNMYDSRGAHKGMRLDHFVADPTRVDIKSIEILHDWHFGSDHTPVLLDFELKEDK